MNMKKWLMDWLLSDQEMRDYAYVEIGAAKRIESLMNKMREDNDRLLSVIDELKAEKEACQATVELEIPKKKRKYNKKKTQE